jgi:hypothetical protein
MGDEMDKDTTMPSSAWWLVKKALRELRSHGYAAVIFSPEELDGCPASDLEGSLVEYAWEAIDRLKKCNTQEAGSEDHRPR